MIYIWSINLNTLKKTSELINKNYSKTIKDGVYLDSLKTLEHKRNPVSPQNLPKPSHCLCLRIFYLLSLKTGFFIDSSIGRIGNEAHHFSIKKTNRICLFFSNIQVFTKANPKHPRYVIIDVPVKD